MFKKVTLTFIVYLVAIFAISSLAEAKSFDSVNRRDHESLKRLIRKRASPPVVAGGVGNEPVVTESAEGADSTPASSSTTSSTSSTSSSISSTSSTSSTSRSSSSTSSSASSTTSSSSTSSSTSSTTSSSTTATTASTTAQTSESFSVAEPPKTSIVPGSQVTLTASVQATPTSSSGASLSGASSDNTPKSKGITAVIVVAACIGGIAILWTVFRKWKLGRSSKFDQRLQPINWQNPTTEDSGIPTHRRRTSDTSSFHSGMQGGASDMGHGSYGHSSSDNGHGAYGATDLPPLPTHDFTAGPAHLAPVGGYADLARGPSPQPQMQEALGRGPSITRHYDPNVPLHHQTGYGATGY